MKFSSAVLLSALAGSQAFVLPHSQQQSRGAGNRRLATLSTTPLFSTAAPEQETYEFTVSRVELIVERASCLLPRVSCFVPRDLPLIMCCLLPVAFSLSCYILYLVSLTWVVSWT